MTQNLLKILSLVFLSAACFSLFNLPTLICFALTIFFTYRYLKSVFERFLSIGLIELLPQTLKNNLLNRSIFDIVCDFWFYDSFLFLKRLLKLLCKPLIEPIQPENAVEALNDMQPHYKKMYLVKGIVNVLPQTLQNIILGKQKAELERLKLMEEEDRSSKQFINVNSSDKNTDDMSEHDLPKRLKRVNSESHIHHPRLEEEHPKKDQQLRQRRIMPFKQHIVSEQKRPKRLTVIQNMHRSLRMLKRLLQMQNISEHIHRTSTLSILKVMFVFWLALYCQMRLNKNARETVIKILYVLGGIVTVLGLVGTTGVLVIKHCRQRKGSGNSSQIQQ